MELLDLTDFDDGTRFHVFVLILIEDCSTCRFEVEETEISVYANGISPRPVKARMDPKTHEAWKTTLIRCGECSKEDGRCGPFDGRAGQVLVAFFVDLIARELAADEAAEPFLGGTVPGLTVELAGAHTAWEDSHGLDVLDSFGDGEMGTGVAGVTGTRVVLPKEKVVVTRAEWTNFPLMTRAKESVCRTLLFQLLQFSGCESIEGLFGSHGEDWDWLTVGKICLSLMTVARARVRIDFARSTLLWGIWEEAMKIKHNEESCRITRDRLRIRSGHSFVRFDTEDLECMVANGSSWVGQAQ